MTKFFNIVAIIVLIFCATLFLNHETILLSIGDFLVIRDNLIPADVIHIIAGPDNRTDYAIQLNKKGYGRQLFFTGGFCNIHQYYHGEHGRQRSIEQGVPSGSIAIDDSQVISTYEEVQKLKEFIVNSPVPINSVIVVSDPFHMRRARWTYNHLLGDGIKVSMAPVTFESSPYHRRWWNDDLSRQTVIDEYLKIAYYYARYQFSGGPVREWLASLDRK